MAWQHSINTTFNSQRHTFWFCGYEEHHLRSAQTIISIIIAMITCNPHIHKISSSVLLSLTDVVSILFRCFIRSSDRVTMLTRNSPLSSSSAGAAWAWLTPTLITRLRHHQSLLQPISVFSQRETVSQTTCDDLTPLHLVQSKIISLTDWLISSSSKYK